MQHEEFGEDLLIYTTSLSGFSEETLLGQSFSTCGCSQSITAVCFFGVILLPCLGFLKASSPQVENHCSRVKASSRVCAVPLTQMLLSLHIHTMHLAASDVQRLQDRSAALANLASSGKISTGPVPALRDQGA